MNTRSAIRKAGPNTGTPIRMKRNELPQMAARVSNWMRCLRSMESAVLSGRVVIVAAQRAVFHPNLAV
jgi:hypothetical protein